MAEDARSVPAVCPDGSELEFNNVPGNTTVSGFLSQIASLPQFATSAPNRAVEADGRRLAGSDRIPESVTIVVVPDAKLTRGFLALFPAAHALLIVVGLRTGIGIGIIVYAVAMLDFGIYTMVARPPLDVVCSSQVPASEMRVLEMFRLFVISFLPTFRIEQVIPPEEIGTRFSSVCFEKGVSVLAFSTYSGFRNIVVVLSK
jgi:hypothetical protein